MHWMSARRCEGFLCDHETTHWLTGSLHHSCSHVAALGGWSCSGSPQPLNSNTRVLKTAVVFPCLLMLSRHISHWRQFFYMPSNLFFVIIFHFEFVIHLFVMYLKLCIYDVALKVKAVCLSKAPYWFVQGLLNILALSQRPKKCLDKLHNVV